ncbi:MAG TPA: DUF1707 domain-containing protein [Streptosporangiaceae bacterium]|jgi:hypothetical protein
MRASDDDREQAIGVLKAAFVQGRLDRDELDDRVSRAFTSRTYAELAAVTADLPVMAAEAPAVPARAPRPARSSVRRVTVTCAVGVLVAELLLFLIVAVLPYYGTLDFAVLANLAGLPLVGGKVLDTWRADRLRRRPPARPARQGPAPAGDRDDPAGPDLTFFAGRPQPRSRACPRPA